MRGFALNIIATANGVSHKERGVVNFVIMTLLGVLFAKCPLLKVALRNVL